MSKKTILEKRREEGPNKGGKEGLKKVRRGVWAPYHILKKGGEYREKTQKRRMEDNKFRGGKKRLRQMGKKKASDSN